MTDMAPNPTDYNIAGNSTRMAEQMSAIQKALAEIAIKKTKEVKTNKYRYTYAGLDAIMDAVLPVLAENGVALLQPPISTPQGAGCRTWLLGDGWTMASDCTFPAGRSGPQEVGSFISYARRYAVLGLLGLAPEEDDGTGERAQQAHRSRQEGQRKREQEQADKAAGRGDAAHGLDVKATLEAFKKHGIPERMLVAEIGGNPLAKATAEQTGTIRRAFKRLNAGEGAEDVFSTAALEAMDQDPDDGLFNGDPTKTYDPADEAPM